MNVTDAPLVKRFPRGLAVTRPRPLTSTASATWPAFSGPNAHDTVGFAVVTGKNSGLSVLITALPHAPK